MVIVLLASPPSLGAEPSAEETLRQRILKSYPQLGEPQLDDFTTACLLRQWAWSHVNHAAGPANIVDVDPEIPWHELTAPAIFELYRLDRGGSFCGGTAHALRKLYEMYGYQAWTVNSGLAGPEAATHVTTLVKIRADRRDLLSMQDAYFNLTYADTRTKAPLDYLEMLGRLAHGEHDTIETREPDFKKIPQWPKVILAAADRGTATPKSFAKAAFSVLESNYTFEERTDGAWIYVSPRTAGKFLEDQCHYPDGRPRWYLEWLVAQGHPENILYLYLYPFGVAGPNGAELLGKAQQVARFSPPR